MISGITAALAAHSEAVFVMRDHNEGHAPLAVTGSRVPSEYLGRESDWSSARRGGQLTRPAAALSG